MKLKRFKIGEATYFCNELQIKEAGSLELAAQKIHDAANPLPKMKTEEVKAIKGEKPNEK
jgi:hypothetical protein